MSYRTICHGLILCQSLPIFQLSISGKTGPKFWEFSIILKSGKSVQMLGNLFSRIFSTLLRFIHCVYRHGFWDRTSDPADFSSDVTYKKRSCKKLSQAKSRVTSRLWTPQLPCGKCKKPLGYTPARFLFVFLNRIEIKRNGE